MTFNSLEYFYFLLPSVLVFYLLPEKFRKYFLVLISIAFYFYYSITYSILLIVISFVIYLAAIKINLHRGVDSTQKKIMYLGFSILLIILLFFKYFQMINSIVNDLFFPSSSKALPLFSTIIAPLGISYYTFKLLSYLIDTYWEKIEPEKDFFSFFLYISFFPQITSGPIQRAVSLLPQINQLEKFKLISIDIGLRLILWGLFKKLVVADRIGIFVDQIYKSPEVFSGNFILYSFYLYPIQLYTDFSGITDIAIGSASLFGLKTPQNFRLPFYAGDIQEYWRRWHITLTEWLRDYIFIPLRMSFRDLGNTGMVLSIFINMILIGIWHGANYTFLCFGLVHGIFMSVSYFTLSFRNKIYLRMKIPISFRKVMGSIFLFHIVAFSMIFFRSENIDKSLLIMKGLFQNRELALENFLILFYLKSSIFIVGIFLIIEYLSRNFFTMSWMYEKPLEPEINQQFIDSFKKNIQRFLFYAFLIVMILAGGVFNGSTFIYNQF